MINPNGDLIIFGNVGQGAEVLASGSIHIYGTLYGRALAGINGDINATITCQKLESELLAIAGQYQVSDDLASEHWQKTCHIHLKDERLIIESV
jgi:septum site-determining protein MinC